MAQDYTHVGNNATQLDVSPNMMPIGKIVLTNANGASYSAQVSGFSEATHSTLEQDDEFASQERANQILAEISGYVYKPYQAADAVVDPLAEVGDGVQVGDVYSIIEGIDYTCDALGTSDIGASSGNEEHHESKYKTVDELKTARMNNTIETKASYEDLATAGRTTINGSNIHSGTITLGGNGNGNGVLRIVDENNNVIGIWDKRNIRVYSFKDLVNFSGDSHFAVMMEDREDPQDPFLNGELRMGCGQYQNILNPGAYPFESYGFINILGAENRGGGNIGEINLVPFRGASFVYTDITLSNSELKNTSGNESIGFDSTGMYYKRNGTKKYFKNLTGW